jgi:phi13 family phage major tail protein
MIIGVKGLTYAKFTSGGEGSAMVYTGGVQVQDMMVRVDQGEEREDASFFADDHKIDRYNGVNGATLSIELARLTTDMREDILGHVAGTGSVYTVTENEAPFLGVGFITKDRYKGTNKYIAYWYYKVQFSEGNRTWNTKGDAMAFQTNSLDGEAVGVTLEAAGKVSFYTYTEVETEAAAVAWLKTQAGIN